MADTPSEEQRDLKRRRLRDSLPIVQAGNNQVVGLVVDISDRGLHLRTEFALELRSRWKLAARFRETVMERTRVEFLAEVRWCHRREQGNGYDVGLHIEQIMPGDAAALTYYAHQHEKA